MNDDRRFERDVASVLAEMAPSRGPDDLLENVFLTTGPMRPRPRWLARIKEPPMRFTNSLAVGSPTARVAAIMVATLLLVIAVAGAGAAGSRLLAADDTIVVDPSGNGTVESITAAVEMAEDGDTILIRHGTYNESLLIEKNITVRGDGAPEDVVITAPEDGPLVSIEWPWGPGESAFAVALVGTEATIGNLTVRGEGSDVLIDGGRPNLEDVRFIEVRVIVSGGSTALLTKSVYESATIFIFDASEPMIESNTLIGGSTIEAYAGDAAVIRDNTIDDVVLHAIEVRAPTRMLIEDNVITGGSGAGIAVGDSIDSAAGYDPLVRRNIISGMATGIFLAPRSNAEVQDNMITGASIGISVSAGSAAEVIGNTVEDVTVGISVSDAQPVIRGNQLRRHTSGLLLVASTALVDGNIVEDGKNGIVLSGPSTNATLIANTVCGNETNVKVVGGAPEPDLRGNDICGSLAVAE